MISKIFLYLGAILPLFWGIAHLFPTKSVVKDFGNINDDNKNIITMEWLIEGISLIFVGVLILVVTILDSTNIISKSIYFLSSIFLIVLAIVSLLTGFKINFLPFKLCPVIFISASALIILGWIF